MNRKWMLALAGVLMVTVLATGCGKKPPVVPEPMAPEPEVMTKDTEMVEPTMPVETITDQGPDWESGELGELNRVAREEGLLGDVHFAYDKSDLSTEATDRLAANAAFMRAQSGLIVTIEGHCDERGTNAYNLALGDRRANTAGGYIANLGIEGSRLSSVSYGEERPQCNMSDSACWARNRRAHFVITGRR